MFQSSSVCPISHTNAGLSFFMTIICLVLFQKFTTAGSSHFVPSLNAITTNQDLQWMVQPSLMHPPGPSRSPVAPYPTMPAARAMGPQPSPSYLLRPGVIRAPTAHSSRRRNDEQVSTRKKGINLLKSLW